MKKLFHQVMKKSIKSEQASMEHHLLLAIEDKTFSNISSAQNLNWINIDKTLTLCLGTKTSSLLLHLLYQIDAFH
jgi:hypothetical protein